MANEQTKTETEYRRLLAEHARSAKTLKEFAEERGLPANRFSWWKREIRRRDGARARERGAAPLAPRGQGSGRVQPQLLPVRVVEPSLPEQAEPARGSTGYELAFGGGRLLRLPTDFDPLRAAALVRAVEATC